MLTFFEQTWMIVLSLFSGDAWEISNALRTPGAFLLSVIIVLGGGYLVLLLLKSLPKLDHHFDRALLVSIYLTISVIIFVEVIRRFVFQVQAPWSTTLPPYLFLIMTWFGCAANVKSRSHLAFNEFRTKLPRTLQLCCLFLDAFLWLTFAIIIVVATLRQTANSAANFQILLGTDDVLQWWFYVFVPVSWVVLSARVMQNLKGDIDRYRTGKPLVEQSAIGSD